MWFVTPVGMFWSGEMDSVTFTFHHYPDTHCRPDPDGELCGIVVALHVKQ